jgi:hypothetical protein
MKNLIITESEKNRILNMHKSRSKNNYLMEQGCLNPTPNYTFTNYMQLPDGVDVAGDPYAMDLASGKYKLTQGCFTGYMIHAGDLRKRDPKIGESISTEINFVSGESVMFNNQLAKILEISDNKYPKVTVDSGKIIRGN